MKAANAYDGARDALFVRSDPVPHDAQEVHGFEFGASNGRPITVQDLMASMGKTGFQASALGKAVEIVQEMVRHEQQTNKSTCELMVQSAHGGIRIRARERPSCLATPPTLSLLDFERSFASW